MEVNHGSVRLAGMRTSGQYCSLAKALDVVVKNGTKTSLKASASSITKGQNLTLTATESPYTAGSVSFYDGKSRVAVVKVSTKGVATYASTKYAVGTQSFTAVFAPTDSALWAGSTSSAVKVTVKS